ncbi:MAG: hypothetical protein KME29_08955 [Calothrix sp. FI2-JRJ7]|jgi:hypothetical protein|nr:hypothetical protein [Calothrix sp. FI2-JRJ7]
MKIVFTGSRNTDSSQSLIVKNKLQEVAQMDAVWHVGDAMGVDALVRIQARRLCTDAPMPSRWFNFIALGRTVNCPYLRFETVQTPSKHY